tara:strand:+ start:125 stop:328 length:204 start_codon:yes stop_codon:yes gene_type:complete
MMRLVRDPLTRRYSVHFGNSPIIVWNRYDEEAVSFPSRHEAAAFLAACRDGGLRLTRQNRVVAVDLS